MKRIGRRKRGRSKSLVERLNEIALHCASLPDYDTRLDKLCELNVIEQIISENGGFDILRSGSKEDEDKLWDVRRAISPSLGLGIFGMIRLHTQ